MNELELVFYRNNLCFPWDKEGAVVVKLDKLGTSTDDVKRQGIMLYRGELQSFKVDAWLTFFLQKNRVGWLLLEILYEDNLANNGIWFCRMECIYICLVIEEELGKEPSLLGLSWANSYTVLPTFRTSHATALADILVYIVRLSQIVSTDEIKRSTGAFAYAHACFRYRM